MSQYYNPKRTRNVFSPTSTESFALSRSKLDLFLQCPRCFYLDRRLGVGRPPGFPFNLNSAVDTLLKQEFDIHRANGTNHPLIEKYGVDARPVAHEDLNIWRENFKGLRTVHEATGLTISGAIDDLWINAKGEYIVVDYKATAKEGDITALDADWHIGYKRQMEIYQWILRHMGHTVSDVGYFVYCNGRTDREAFDGKLEFDVTLITYKGNDGWVDECIKNAHACLMDNRIPMRVIDCDYCAYVDAVGGATQIK